MRRSHADAERRIDRSMANTEAEQHAPPAGLPDQRGRLGTGVGVAKVNIGDPGSDLDARVAVAVN